jgi:hypothetical protein
MAGIYNVSRRVGQRTRILFPFGPLGLVAFFVLGAYSTLSHSQRNLEKGGPNRMEPV